MEGFLNLTFGYIIIAIPALIVVLLFRRKSKKDLEKFDESKYHILDHDKKDNEK
jgi:biopolymer transport protein ExbB/TolQ